MSDFSNEDLVTVQKKMTDSPHVSVVKLYVTFFLGILFEEEKASVSVLFLLFVCLKWINIIKMLPSSKSWGEMLWTYWEFGEFEIFWNVCVHPDLCFMQETGADSCPEGG